MKVAGDLRCDVNDDTKRLKLVGQKCTGQLLDCLLQVTLTQRYRLETGVETATSTAPAEIQVAGDGGAEAAAAESRSEQTLVASTSEDTAVSTNNGTATSCTSDSVAGDDTIGHAAEAEENAVDLTSSNGESISDTANCAPPDEANTAEPATVVYWLAVNTEEAVLTGFEAQSDSFHFRRDVGPADMAKRSVAAHRDTLKAGQRPSTSSKATLQSGIRNRLRQQQSAADTNSVNASSARRFLNQLNLSAEERAVMGDVVVRCYRTKLGKAWPWRDVEISVTYVSLASVVNDWIEVSLPTALPDTTRYNPHRRKLAPTRRKTASTLAATGDPKETHGQDTAKPPATTPTSERELPGKASREDEDKDMGTSGDHVKVKLKRFRSTIDYGISASIKVIVPGEVTSLLSPSHGGAVKVRTYGSDSHRAAVEYGPDADAIPKRIDVKVQHTRNSRPCATLLEKPTGVGVGSAAMLSIAAPDFSALGLGRSSAHIGEFIFMVDQSGSMSAMFTPVAASSSHRIPRGRKANSFMDQAKSTLLLFLHSLPSPCFFNIIGFGSRRLRLFKQSELYNDNTLRDARKHVSGLTNNLGGTDLLRPLAEVLDAKPALENAPRCVFVLTDGAVSADDTAEVFRKVRIHARSTRIFSLGIGTSAGRHLVRGLAHFGNGLYSFITSPTQDMSAVVIKQLSEALRPPLMAPIIDWGELSLQFQFPANDCLVPVCPGRPYTVFAVLKSASSRKSTVKLKGTTSGQRLEEETAVEPTQTDSRNRWKFLHQYAAAMHLTHLQRKAEDRFSTAPRLERNKLLAIDNEAMAVLSVQYQVYSSTTTELLLDLSPPVDGTSPSGAPIAQDKLAGSRLMEHVHLQPTLDKLSDPVSGTATGMAAAPRKHSTPTGTSASKTNVLRSVSMTELPSEHIVDPVHRLTKLQQANGLWLDGIGHVAELLFIEAGHLASGCGCTAYNELQQMTALSGDDIASIWTTLVVLTFLRTHCPGQRDMLMMITEKAKHAVVNVLLSHGAQESVSSGIDFVNLQLNGIAQTLKPPKPK